mgnify:CR=1 FL=1
MEFAQNMNLVNLSTAFKKFPTRGYLKFRFTSLIISLRTIITLSKYLKKTKPEFLFVSMMPFIAWRKNKEGDWQTEYWYEDNMDGGEQREKDLAQDLEDQGCMIEWQDV